jgi:hypothetical protein
MGGTVTGEEASALFQLRYQWQGSYFITLSESTWSAQRLDDPAVVLTAGTAPELRRLMQEDDARRRGA